MLVELVEETNGFEDLDIHDDLDVSLNKVYFKIWHLGKMELVEG